MKEEITFDELYQDQNFSGNSDNFKKLSDRRNTVIYKDGKLTVLKIK